MKISILTPSYNAVAHIERAIQSVLDQDYIAYEHIIVDGGSQDGTVEILKKYPHLIWKSEKDNGQSDAMNKAFNMATGDVISYLNADDYYLPGAFSYIVQTFTSQPEVAMVVGDLYIEQPDGSRVTNTNATIKYEDLRIIRGRFPLNPVSYFYKKEVQDKIGNFPVDEHYTMDFWFLIRAFHTFHVIKVPELLGVFVFSEDNKTANYDSFKEQRSIALRYVYKHDRANYFEVFKRLHLHPRSTSILKKIYHSIKK